MPDSTTPQDPGAPGTQGDPANTQTGTPGDPAKGGEKTYATWVEYVADHPEAAPLHEAEKSKLHKALQDEREKNKQQSTQLRELAKTADPATADALRAEADKKDAENDALRKQLDFQSAAVALGCRAVDKAWAMAQVTNMTAEQMKNDPDLAHWFAPPAGPTGPPRVSAGAGAGQTAGVKDDFNTRLRRAALGGG
jgi:hypothetical protein